MCIETPEKKINNSFNVGLEFCLIPGGPLQGLKEYQKKLPERTARDFWRTTLLIGEGREQLYPRNKAGWTPVVVCYWVGARTTSVLHCIYGSSKGQGKKTYKVI